MEKGEWLAVDLMSDLSLALPPSSREPPIPSPDIHSKIINHIHLASIDLTMNSKLRHYYAQALS